VTQAMSDSMSTKEFLLSKESRPLLIGILVLLLFFGGIFYWAISSLFSSPERPDPDSLATGGGSTIEAPRKEQGGSSNLTSDSLNDEAQQAARDYNELTASDDSLHPVPLFDDVAYIPIGDNDDETDQNSALELPSGIPEQRYTYTPPAIPEGATSNRSRDLERERREREARLKAREDAARAIMQTYDAAPAIASFTMKPLKTGEADAQGDLSRVGVDGNNGGRPSFVEGNENAAEGQCKAPLVKGGQIAYANNDIALNTDFAGPVRATFLGGELNGWTGMGTFELNEFGAKMKPMLNKLISPAGTEYTVRGYVLDPDTTLWAIRSDVDYHIIYRYGGFGLATILSGFQELAEARSVISERTGINGETTNEYREPDGKQITWTLLGAFSELWREAFADNINRPITVTLDPNVQVGVLFESTVCKVESETEKAWAENEAKRKAGFIDPVKKST